MASLVGGNCSETVQVACHGSGGDGVAAQAACHGSGEREAVQVAGAVVALVGNDVAWQTIRDM